MFAAPMPDESPQHCRLKAEIVEVTAEQAGQRIDNFLIKYMKGVPRSRLYRALRGGEVRVNSARKQAPYQLCVGDKVRIPPIRRSAEVAEPAIPASLLRKIPVLFEDRHLLVVDKPAGLAVHGGTGMDYGLIEALRKLRSDLPYLELAHRLDRETSGCLMLAKSRASLLGVAGAARQRAQHREKLCRFGDGRVAGRRPGNRYSTGEIETRRCQSRRCQKQRDA